MKFELTKKEIKAKDKFYKACKELLDGQDVNLYYVFTPTGIGNAVTVGCKALGVEKDITDMDNW